ncbi:hypothetical protein ES703_78235 [subsurface metagenome]
MVRCKYPGLNAKKNAANNPVARLSTSFPKKYIASTVIPPIIAGKKKQMSYNETCNPKK